MSAEGEKAGGETARGEQAAVVVALRLQHLYEDALWDRPIVVRGFTCGTSGTWVWATFRLTAQFAGAGAALRRGVIADANDVTGESDVDRIWRDEVCRRAEHPRGEGAVLRDGVWWREVGLHTPHSKTLR